MPQLIDLHNHTHRSYDSSNRIDDYRRAYEHGRFHVLGITDHNTIEGALELAEAVEFEVVVGEEVDTADGELVGLFLSRPLTPGRTMVATAHEIRAQGGLVYLQHPFHRFIRGTPSPATISALVQRGLVDIVEVCNGGLFMAESNRRAALLAAAEGLVAGAGSDAHHPRGIGRCAVAAPDGPLTPPALLERLRAGVVVDDRRSSLATLGGRAAYSVGTAARRVVGDGERKRR